MRYAAFAFLFLVLSAAAAPAASAVEIVWPLPRNYAVVGFQAIFYWLFFPGSYRLVFLYAPPAVFAPMAYRIDVECRAPGCGVSPATVDELKEMVFGDDEYIESIADAIRFIAAGNPYYTSVLAAELTRSLVYRDRGKYNSLPRWPRDVLISGYGVCYDSGLTLGAILYKAGVPAAVILGTVYTADGGEAGHAATAVPFAPKYNTDPVLVNLPPLNATFYLLDGTMEAKKVPELFPRFVDIGYGYKFKQKLLVLYGGEAWSQICYSTGECEWVKA